METKRNEKIEVKVTSEQKELIKLASDKVGKDMSEFIRDLILPSAKEIVAPKKSWIDRLDDSIAEATGLPRK